MRDPKDVGRLFDNRTLWLDQDANEVARERFWYAYMRTVGMNRWPGSEVDQRRAEWDIAWAAAVAVCSFVLEGNLGPKTDDEP